MNFSFFHFTSSFIISLQPWWKWPILTLLRLRELQMILLWLHRVHFQGVLVFERRKTPFQLLHFSAPGLQTLCQCPIVLLQAFCHFLQLHFQIPVFVVSEADFIVLDLHEFHPGGLLLFQFWNAILILINGKPQFILDTLHIFVISIVKIVPLCFQFKGFLRHHMDDVGRMIYLVHGISHLSPRRPWLVTFSVEFEQ